MTTELFQALQHMKVLGSNPGFRNRQKKSFYEPMSCRIALRIQLAKQNKDPAVRKKFMGLGAITKKFSIKVQKKNVLGFRF